MGFKSIGELCRDVIVEAGTAAHAAKLRANMNGPADELGAQTGPTTGVMPGMGMGGALPEREETDRAPIAQATSKLKVRKAGATETPRVSRMGHFDPSPAVAGRPILSVVRCGPTHPPIEGRTPRPVRVGPHLVTIEGVRVHAGSSALRY